MKKHLLAFFCLFISFFSFSQCPTADFNVSGSVCPDQPVTFNNTSSNAASYLWDFCAGDFSTTPSASDYAATTPNPYAMTTVFDGSNWYGFVVNSSPAGITRLDFGPSLSKTTLLL